MRSLIKPSDSLLPKKGKILPKGAYKCRVKARFEHQFVGVNPSTGKPEDFVTWKYLLEYEGAVELLAFSHDTFDIDMLVVAWVDVRREKDEKHVPRSFNVVTQIREIRPGKRDPRFVIQ